VTGYTHARRFAEVLADLTAYDTPRDKWTINFLANRVATWAGISPRQVTRWIVGDSTPREGRSREQLTAAWRSMSPADRATLEPHLEALFASPSSGEEPATARSAVPDEVEAYLERISDREYQERARRTPIPIRGLLEGGWPGQREIASSAEPLSELTGLLKQRGGTVRVRLAGPHPRKQRGEVVDHAGLEDHAGLDDLCLRLAALFARAFAAGAASAPLPLLVEWADLRGAALAAGPEATLETLLVDVLLRRDRKSPLGIPDTAEGMRTGRIAMIVRGVRLRNTDDWNAWNATAGLLKEAPRLVAAWHEGDSPKEADGFFSHTLTLLHPPDILWTARECRRRLGEGNPDLPHLGTIADSVKLLGTRPVGGRVLALIDHGALHPLAFSSNSTLAASLLLQSILAALPPFARSGNEGQSRDGQDQTLTLFPAPQASPVLQTLLPHVTAENARSSVFGDFVGGEENAVKWVDPSFEGGLTFLMEWFAPSEASADDALAWVDAEGNRLLACKQDRRGGPRWEGVVERVLGMLEGKGPLTARWAKVQREWSRFEGALGYMRGVIDRNREKEEPAAEKLRDAVLDQMGAFWDAEREPEDALGTVRYHGARAAAVLFDARQLCERLKIIEESRSPGELAFASEIALRVAGRFYDPKGCGVNPFTLKTDEAVTGADMVAGQLLDTIAACRTTARDRRGELHLRHARYHAVTAFVRFAPPPVLRRGAQLLLPEVGSGVLSESNHLRNFAIESAALLGGLRDAGAAWPMVPGPVTGYLVDSIDAELARYEDPPLFVSAHRYLAYQAISPMMLSSRRAKLLDTIHRTLPAVDEMARETAALRYLLYYLRQELAAGLLPDADTRRFLSDVDAALNEGPEDEDGDSPEQRNRRDLAELIRWLPS